MDFALILFVLSIVTGVLWFFDKLVARKKRPKGTPDPWWVEYGASFFSVILPIFLLRSFWVEPFRIPSGSMIPTLLVGDFILVNKYAYGIRLPVIDKKIFDIGSPQRGEIMVFRYPHDTTQDYIKRVVGLPGDRIDYFNKRLTINGKEVPVRPDGDYLNPQTFEVSQKFEENLGGKKHTMLNDRYAEPFVPEGIRVPHAFSDNCKYTSTGLSCIVPPGNYFMMGDNRDQSADSRVWGFVPDENIVGKAVYIWFHADSILPPKGISFGRDGSLN